MSTAVSTTATAAPVQTSAKARSAPEARSTESRPQDTAHDSGRKLAESLVSAMIPAYTWLLSRGCCAEAQALFRCGIAAAGALCSAPGSAHACRGGTLRRLVFLSLALRKQHPEMPDPLSVGNRG